MTTDFLTRGESLVAGCSTLVDRDPTCAYPFQIDAEMGGTFADMIDLCWEEAHVTSLLVRTNGAGRQT